MTLDKIKCFLLDMDGTLYLGNHLIEGAVDAVSRMKNRARVLFVTNNSSTGAANYYKKLKNFGFELGLDDIYGSTRATIDYLREHHAGKRVFLCATEDVTEEFAAAGIILAGNRLCDAVPDIALLTFDKTMTYDKLQRFCAYLCRGALFIATHPDKVCPTADGTIPDIGSFLKAIKCATSRKPDIICGKPYKAFGQSIIKMTGLKPYEIAMVGDRLSTDLKFAKNCGFVSVTVLSGEAKTADIQKLKSPPDYVLGSIADWDKGEK
ncbi:MAG: HAD-IIA family hydrolase [Firmicutes bacterium]|nr:HAD-IIA family hydrolase [Bacillota bacterium]